MNDSHQPPENPRKTGEKLWNATLKTLQSASSRAAQYKRIVQKKIDLNSIHKKIGGLHSDLGKLVDDARGEAPEEILGQSRVQDILHQLDGLKHAAATLGEEIEAIKAEQPASEKSS
jgi:hypothetical protein